MKLPEAISVSFESVILLLLAGLFAYILFIRTLQKTLLAISVENRKMQPGKVWLMLIPLYGHAWSFFVVKSLADSIKAEAITKEMQMKDEKASFHLGFTMCILNCLVYVPFFQVITIPLFLSSWAFYWSEISTYKNRIQRADVYDA